MKKFSQLSDDAKQAMAYLARNPAAMDGIISILQEERKLESDRYEIAKDFLVAQGDNRPVCLQLKGRLSALDDVISLFDQSRKI